ncbi:hypothetical protein AB4Z13_15875 [Rhizobium sp. YAF28]|uniref:hypothetical protein n=1 Tax=Rhizobium sp. YAF28 TaxID=3233081 RepID=UPI003F9C45FA
MDRLLIAFIRQRMPDRFDVDLGEFFDTAEGYFKQHSNTKLDARTFFDALRVVQLERLQQIRSSNREHNRYSR